MLRFSSPGLLAFVSLLCVCIGNIEAVFEIERCFEELGCFAIGGPFFDPIDRPVNVLPNAPSSINTVFRLYTNRNKYQPQFIENEANFEFNSTNFDRNLETKIVIHGFREMEGDWMIDLKDELLNLAEPMNVITVEWKNGATVPYTLASSNTRVVGAQIALLIRRLKASVDADLSRFHLIGFSLGSHIAGYAGEKLKGQIRRITGLDPAGPLFAGLPAEVRLDPSDARFVDAIHTDAKSILELSFGTIQSVGHVDFYPNGGHNQPGCPHNYFSKIGVVTIDVVLKGLDEAGEEAVCRHSRANKIFIESISGALPAVAYPCKNYEKFLAGECQTCGKDGALCGVMGLAAEQFAPINAAAGGVRLFLATGDQTPYVRFHYIVRIQIPKDDSNIGRFGFNVYIKRVSFGKIEATLHGEFNQSFTTDLNVNAQVFEGETEYSFLVVSPIQLGEIKAIDLQFKPSSGFESFINLKWKINEELTIESIEIVDMFKLFKQRQNVEALTYCSPTKILKPKKTAVYTVAFVGRNC